MCFFVSWSFQIIITYVGKPHQQVLANLTSACGASIHITTKQGAKTAPSCLALWCMPGCNNLPQWQCNQMSTQRGPCIASFGVPPGNNHMSHVHVPNEALSTANKVLLVLLPKKQVPGVQMDVPTLCRPCFNQGYGQATSCKHPQLNAISSHWSFRGAQPVLLVNPMMLEVHHHGLHLLGQQGLVEIPK